MEKKLTFIFDSVSGNESFARNVVASFCLSLNPSVDEIIDIKTAVSEAVTNVIVHAYPEGVGKVKINVTLKNSRVYISVKDSGKGIECISKAIEPFFTTKPDQDRSGMGFTVIESFMDNVSVKNNKGKGVTVYMVKKILGTDKCETMAW